MTRSSPSSPLSALTAPFRRFAKLQSASGVLLLACAALALAWANSPLAPLYHAWKEFPVLPFDAHGAPFSFALFVNDVLMAVFFLGVGLEIKRELLEGELASRRKAMLPLAGALGGMLAPALIYAALNAGGPAARGWGVPMATDIAFALGVILLLGKRVPPGLKVFLVALAILDDLGAILVIALFYTDHLAPLWLGAALALIVALALLNRARITHPLPYLLGGVALWIATFQSGVHATLAGVALAFCIPARPGPRERALGLKHDLQARFEHALHPWVSFAILPLFAVANAGVALSPSVVGALGEPLGLGILGGLLLGKPLGITLAAWLAVRLGLAALPQGVRWGQMAGAGLLGGIGFTMSIFIAGLAFADPARLDGAKLSVLAASLTAGICGYLVLRLGASGARVARAKERA